MEDNANHDVSTPWRVLRDTAILSGVGSLFTLVKPLRAIVLARMLEPHNYGLLNIPLPYVQVVSIFANMGLSAALLRIISVKLGQNDPAAAKSTYHKGIALAFASSVFWSLLLSLFGPTIALRYAEEPQAVSLMIAGAWMIPGTTLIAIYGNLFLAYGRAPLLGVVKSIYSFLSLAIPVVLVLAFKMPLHVLVGFVFVELAGAFIAFYQFRKKVNARIANDRPLEPERMGSLLKLAHSFFYTNLGWMLINTVDRIMIQKYCETEILGFYAVAVFFSNFLNIIPMSFAQVITPTLTKSLTRNELENAWNTLKRSTRVVSFVLAPLVVFTAVFSYDLVNLLFSYKFVAASSFLKILAFTALLNFLCKLSWSIIVSEANPGARSVVYLIAAAVNIALNLYLIPRYGGTGAAWGSVLAFATLTIMLQVFLYRKITRILPLSAIVPPFLVATVSIGIYAVIHHIPSIYRLVVGVAASLILYVIISGLCGILRKSDIQSIRAKTSHLPGPIGTTSSIFTKIVGWFVRE